MFKEYAITGSRGCQTVAVDGSRSCPSTTGRQGENPYFMRPFVRPRPRLATHGRIRLPLGLDSLTSLRGIAGLCTPYCVCIFLCFPILTKRRSNNFMRTYIRMAKGCYKYDWPAVQRYYDEGNGYVRCRERFGFAKDTWIKAIRCGRIVVRPRQWPLERILQDSRSRYTVKRRLLAAGLLKNACEECGLAEWRGRPLAIQIDHRNGVNDDHRLENLRMLCPNCHSQTATYAARNRRRFPQASKPIHWRFCLSMRQRDAKDGPGHSRGHSVRVPMPLLK